MDYLTNYYKNLCENLQAKVNNLETIINEAKIRNPNDQFSAGLHRDKEMGWQNRRADQQPVNSYVARYEAGWNRMNDMLHYQAAHAIAEPHEQEAIERVLTDMANTTPNASGTAANMGHMRTAIGAVKRVKGTEAFAKSLSAVRAPIEREALKQVDAEDTSREEDENYFDAYFDAAQKHILGPRKNVDSRTAAIRQQPQLGRYSPSVNPGRVM
jgi:hypothetical protein